jgi:hypothetical protein
LLALALAAAVLAHESYARRPGPRSVAELVDRLHAAGILLRAVPVGQSIQDLENGAYLCERNRHRKELARLYRAAERRADWVGVVHCERWPRHEDTVEFILREWQSCSARVGDVLLFGDPDLLRRIVEVSEH